MKKRLYQNTKNMIPYLFFSVLVGFLAALIGTCFKLGAQWGIDLSATVYSAVRQNLMWVPVMLMGAAGLGLTAGILVSRAQSCKGGGIPTAVAAVRGIVSFNWISGILVLPFSALLTFLCGLPLGTEGPCVQMGTAIGDGVIQCLGSKKNQGWRRYVMTGGASAGFSIATAAPISAILFAIEELHKVFSPLLLTGVSLSVMTAQLTAQILSCFGIGAGGLFHLPEIGVLPATLLFVPVLIGLVCGISSVLFTRLYHAVERLVHSVLERVPIKILFPILFTSVSAVGLSLADTLGTGHALVDQLFYSHIAWYVLVLVFLLRAAFMMVSNTAGVTGGVFLPTLAFGGMIGSLCADGMTALGLLEPQYRILIVILGITAFLGATSRIPLTACVFALEALGGIHNILALVIATTVAYLGAELSGVEDFTDSVIAAKKRRIRKGTAPTVLVAVLTVQENSFAVGKELRDILWPDACVVVSVERGHQDHDITALRAGDVLTLRYKTYDPEVTAEELRDLVGEQRVNANA